MVFYTILSRCSKFSESPTSCWTDGSYLRPLADPYVLLNLIQDPTLFIVLNFYDFYKDLFQLTFTLSFFHICRSLGGFIWFWDFML